MASSLHQGGLPLPLDPGLPPGVVRMLTREEALAIYQAGPQTVVPVFLEMAADIHALEQRVEELQVQPLQDQRAKNSRTAASRPPAMGSTNLRPRAFARKQRQSGGQPGHKGHTLKRVEKPDRTIHRLDACECCGRPLGDQPPEQVEKPSPRPAPPASGRNQTLLLRPEPRGLPRRGQRPGAIRSTRPGRGRLFEQLSVPAL